MPHPLHELSFFLYACIGLFGAVTVLSRVLHKFTAHIPLLRDSSAALSLSVLPVAISYIAFIRLWAIPWLTELVLFACAIAGVFTLWNKRHTVKNLDRSFLPAATIVVITLLHKIAYFTGGFTHGDEMRSFALTVGFATNALIPAFPYDFSLPFAYPYYTFETAAFLYRGMHGLPYPSVAILALTLATLLAVFQLLRTICRDLFGDHVNATWPVLTCAIFLSSMVGFKKLFGWMPSINVQIHSAGELIDAGSHYLLAMSWGLLAIVALARRRNALDRENLLTAAVGITLAFGHAGIPAVVAAVGAVVLLVRAVIVSRFPTIRTILTSLAIGIVIVFPQVWNLLPRIGPTFTLASFPNFWWPRTAVSTFGDLAGSAYVWANIKISLAILVLLMGPLLLGALLFGLIVGWKRRGWKDSDEPWRGFLFAIIAIITLFTFTYGPSNDWVSRGWVMGTSIGALFFTKLFIESSKHVKTALVACLAVLFVSLGMELPPRVAHEFSEVSTRAHGLPFGTIVAGTEFSETLASTLIAGRAVLSIPPPYHVAYLLSQETLEKYDLLGDHFVPCIKTWYGYSVPRWTSFFVETEGKFLEATCDSAQMQS